MTSYETTATVEEQGQIRIAGVPFAAGTQVEVTISPKRLSAEEFAVAWQNVCADLRGRSALKDISEEGIREEISKHRAGK